MYSLSSIKSPFPWATQAQRYPLPIAFLSLSESVPVTFSGAAFPFVFPLGAQSTSGVPVCLTSLRLQAGGWLLLRCSGSTAGDFTSS